MIDLPQEFVARMSAVLGDELPTFLRTYEEPYQRAIRFNPRKPVEETDKPEGVLDGVAWESAANYLTVDSGAGAAVLHEAGAWYLQEPSAMVPVAVLDPQPGEVVLDLCAAPGGKSTQIAGRMAGRGLLVSNEPVGKRAAILSRNMERMGVTNGLTVSAMPDQLAKRWGACFDAVLVDAPCSGEGMFRRHPETREEWTAQSPAGCAGRQLEILRSAARLVRRGGRLVYSTCTLNRTENEDNIAAFLGEHADFSLVPFALAGIGACEGMKTLYPHKVRGEGHFVALLRRAGDGTALDEDKSGLPAANKETLKALDDFCQAAQTTLPRKPRMLGGTAVLLPAVCPPLDGVKVLRAGVHLGEMRGKLFFPDHAWAVSVDPPNAPRIALTEAEARRYQAGEELAADEQARGFVLPCFGGLPLGWGKASDGRMKNHYPKGLRR